MATLLMHEFGLPAAGARERLPAEVARRAALTARDGIVTARLEERDSDRAVIERAWAPYGYGSGAITLAGAVGDLLRGQERRLVTAESCTAGWVGRLITDVSGSSRYYRGGWIAYADDLKTTWLGVPRGMMEAHGAVSAPCALALARGALDRGGADEALAITGIAGPLGGTADKPVGTVFIALARRGDHADDALVRRFQFPGKRSRVRGLAAHTALQMLRLALLGAGPGVPMQWEREAP